MGADAIRDQLVTWRRFLHRRPELGLEEHETSAFLQKTLTELGIEIHTGYAGTGVVGVLRCGRPDAGAVLLRADMDGLPVQEVDGRDYGSEIPQRMHACGHDGHMAMLLGAATQLKDRDDLPRDVLLCFQPGEEGFGGAEKMIAGGVLDLADVQAVYGLHLWSQFDVGTVQLRPGPAMAAQDEMRARFIGRGGHGALPHNTIDPIVAASQAVVTLQQIVSRNIDPLEAAVITIGAIRGGEAANVIPDFAEIEATMRAFDGGVRNTIRERAEAVCRGVATATGCELDYELLPGYPPVVNNADAVAKARRVAIEAFGESAVIEHAPMAAAEDFSYFLNERPGAFIFIGARNQERGITAAHHSPNFDIDEAALPIGTELLTKIALAP
ncbi:MAG: M20 family metallopeptidase [Acidobacteriota bacterium]|nr:M20 family metallopeptidase [Acidobacteriota bacterium]MDH3784668.1 M20 family metallopeptidase [Acidobacteriota bacterium]